MKTYKEINQYANEKYERITILVPKGRREFYQKESQKRGISTSKFIVECVNYYLENCGK